MLKRGWIFLSVILLSCSIFTLSVTRTDFAFQRIKPQTDYIGQLKTLFEVIASEAEALKREFKREVEKLREFPPDDIAFVEDVEDIDPVALAKALEDSTWGRLSNLMREIGTYGNEEVKYQTILFLLPKATNLEESPYVRNAAIFGLEGLFSFLDSKQRCEVLFYLGTAYEMLVKQGMPIGRYFKVISGFIPYMSEEEIGSLSQPFLTYIAFYCADNLLESDIEILSRVIKYLEPVDQKVSLIRLMNHFLSDDNEAYKHVVSLSIVDLFLNNLPHCQNEEFLDAAFKWAIVLLDSPGTPSRGIKIVEALEGFLEPGEWNILREMLD